MNIEFKFPKDFALKAGIHLMPVFKTQPTDEAVAAAIRALELTDADRQVMATGNYSVQWTDQDGKLRLKIQRIDIYRDSLPTPLDVTDKQFHP